MSAMGRNPNGRSSVYQNAEGWHGRLTVGVKDNGDPDRRHVRGKTKTEEGYQKLQRKLSRISIQLLVKF